MTKRYRIHVGSTASLLQDDAVLPRDVPLVFFGCVNPEMKVHMEIGEWNCTVDADIQGDWSVESPPFAASSRIRFSVTSANYRLVFTNICFGDLWLCSGQSNMVMTVANADGGDAVMADAKDDLIREFRIKRAVAFHPLTQINGFWHKCVGEQVGDTSAVAFYFARRMRGELGVPIGIITAASSSTPIASWLSRKTLLSQKSATEDYDLWWKDAKKISNLSMQFDDLHRDWLIQCQHYRQEVETPYLREFSAALAKKLPPPPLPRERPQSVASKQSPTFLYNGMISPLVGLPLKGVLWYQGESDTWFESDALKYRAKNYESLLRSLILSWREAWENIELPFFIAQLANFNARPDGLRDTGWARVREAQIRVANLPFVYTIPTIDLGEAVNIHPRHKEPVGERLAKLALQKLFNASYDAEAPLYLGMQMVEKAMHIKIASLNGLRIHHCAENGFLCATANRYFKPADIIVYHNVIIASAKCPDPIVAVRYAWEDNPVVSVYGNNSLPLFPFRTDDWDI